MKCLFDALITGISTPSVDGLELLRFAKTVDADLPVVLMTGAPDLETAAQAIELSALQYLHLRLVDRRTPQAPSKRP